MYLCEQIVCYISLSPVYVRFYLSIYLSIPIFSSQQPSPKKKRNTVFSSSSFFSFFLSLLFLTYFPCLYLSLSCPTYSCVPVPVPFIFGINHTIYIDCPLNVVTAPSNSQRVFPGTGPTDWRRSVCYYTYNNRVTMIVYEWIPDLVDWWLIVVWWCCHYCISRN